MSLGGEDSRWPVAWTNRLQRLATALSGVVDPSAMARAAVDAGMEALEAEGGIVFLLSADGETVEIAHTSGVMSQVTDAWRRFPVSASLPASEAIRRREPVLVRSREELLRRYPTIANDPDLIARNSWAAVPLVLEGACMGALGFAFVVAQAFEPPAVAFLRVVADQCAQTLHRAQLTERERRSSARLRVLAEASRVFAVASLDVRSTLNALGAQVLAHMASSCSIALASPDGEWLDIAMIQDRNPERERLLREMTTALRVRRGEGVSGKVLATGESVLIPIVAPDEMAKRTAPSVAPRIEELRVRSFLAVALKTGGRTLGTITTSRYDEGTPFSDEDRTLLEDLADRAALAIENARLHEAERAARARAEEADRRKDEFLAMLGHELRNPLQPIWTAVEILRQLPAPSDHHGWARDVLGRQVAQLSRLVDDLLDVSRINLGRIALRMETLDLGVVALQALEASRPLLSQRQHVVSVEMPAVPVRVRGDAVRLTQIIANLLNNAAQYTDPAGDVRLRVASHGTDALVIVSDSGIGISPEMIGRVFDLFTQGHAARDRSAGGLGVGLTLVKRLVEMHGGYVRVSSPGPGRGSEFLLGFPLFDAAAAPTSGGESLAGQPAWPRRILVVDDNADAAQALRVLLELQRYEVEVAQDGLAAIEAASRSRPEVVLLDISMPGIDGLEVARRIRALDATPRPLLVAITGLGHDEDRHRSADAGFDQHLVKPVDPATLATLLALAPRPGDAAD